MIPMTIVMAMDRFCLPGTMRRASSPAMSPTMMMVTMSPSMVVPLSEWVRTSTSPPLGLVQYTPRGVYGRYVNQSGRPITVALVDDYDVVVMGVAQILGQYRDRVVVAEIDTNEPVVDVVDIVLYDSFAQPESDQQEISVLVRNPNARRVVVFTWNFHPDLVASARAQGVRGYLSKALPARELGGALEAVPAGEVVVSEVPGRVRPANGLDWPGRGEGLTDRESEILALITQGLSNADVAGHTYLSPNTVKSYIRSVYRKIGVESRTQAVLWGVAHGFVPDHRRIDHWRAGA